MYVTFLHNDFNVRTFLHNDFNVRTFLHNDFNVRTFLHNDFNPRTLNFNVRTLIEHKLQMYVLNEIAPNGKTQYDGIREYGIAD